MLGARSKPTKSSSLSWVLRCGVQPALTIGVAILAWWVATSSSALGGVKRSTLALASAGGAVASLVLQLIGHWLFEPITAPPDVFHGLVAAVALEYFSLVVRLGLAHEVSGV